MIQIHHRRARGAGGTSGVQADAKNSPDSLMALGPACHNRTEDAATWAECERMGWRIRQDDPRRAQDIPVLIYTVNGYGWWHLLPDGDYRWCDIKGGEHGESGQ